jgi:glutathione S-transferase
MQERPVTLHVVPLSHPCMTVRAGLERKGLRYEEVMLESGQHADTIEEIYGPGRRTVPGIVMDGEPVHGSVGILRHLDRVVPENPLYPEEIAEEVREAETWGDRVFQELARRLPFGALHFRPGSMGTFAGAGELDPAGTDFAIKSLRHAWKYQGLSAVRLTNDLEELPAAIAKIESFAERGILGGDEPTAADFQIGASARLLLTIEDLHPLMAGTAAERIARRHFPDYDGRVPAGAFPDGWVRL